MISRETCFFSWMLFSFFSSFKFANIVLKHTDDTIKKIESGRLLPKRYFAEQLGLLENCVVSTIAGTLYWKNSKTLGRTSKSATALTDRVLWFDLWSGAQASLAGTRSRSTWNCAHGIGQRASGQHLQSFHVLVERFSPMFLTVTQWLTLASHSDYVSWSRVRTR